MKVAEGSIIDVYTVAASVAMGVVFTFVAILIWYSITNERMRGKLKFKLIILKLRLKFKRMAITCQVCGGNGEYPHSGGFGDIYFDCTRCGGSGIAYLYIYRFNWWVPKDRDGWSHDQDLVEMLLGDSAESVQTRAMLDATRGRDTDT